MYSWKITLIDSRIIRDFSNYVEIDDKGNLILFDLEGIWPFKRHVGGTFIAEGYWTSVEEIEVEEEIEETE